MSEEPEISEKLAAMLEKAINIDLDHLRNSRIIQTWILARLKGTDEYSITVITDLEENTAISEARKRIREQADIIDAYIIGFNGVIPVEGGEKVKGLFYECSEATLNVGYYYMVGYSIDPDGSVNLDENYNGFLDELEKLI